MHCAGLIDIQAVQFNASATSSGERVDNTLTGVSKAWAAVFQNKASRADDRLAYTAYTYPVASAASEGGSPSMASDWFSRNRAGAARRDDVVEA